MVYDYDDELAHIQNYFYSDNYEYYTCLFTGSMANELSEISKKTAAIRDKLDIHNTHMTNHTTQLTAIVTEMTNIKNKLDAIKDKLVDSNNIRHGELLLEYIKLDSTHKAAFDAVYNITTFTKI